MVIRDAGRVPLDRRAVVSVGGSGVLVGVGRTATLPLTGSETPGGFYGGRDVQYSREGGSCRNVLAYWEADSRAEAPKWSPACPTLGRPPVSVQCLF